jgi:uncharacterized membrane protein
VNSSAPAPLPAAPVVIRIRFWSEVARIMLIFMELLLVSSWYSGLDAQTLGWGLVALILGGVMLISHYLARLLNLLRLPEARRRIFFAGWVALALFGSLKLLMFPGQPVRLLELVIFPFTVVGPGENASLGGFVHLLLVGFLIWRGVILAASPASIQQIQRSFQVGILILILYGMSLGRLQQAGFGTVFAYLVLGMLGMAAARMSSVSDLRGGRAGRFSPDWIAAIAASALLLVALGLLSGILLHSPLEWLVKAVTGVILAFLALLLVGMAYPLLWIVQWFGPLLSQLFANLPQLSLFQEIQAWAEQLAGQPFELLTGMSGLFNASRVGMRILAVAVIIVVILLLMRFRALRRRAETEEETSNVDVDLRWPWQARNPRRLLEVFPGARRWLAAAQIRRIYADLMALLRQMQHPRPEALTPLEFLPHMQALLPAQTGDLEQITHAYLKVRYGQLSETMEEVRAVEQAWARVRAAGKQELAEMRARKKESTGS